MHRQPVANFKGNPGQIIIPKEILHGLPIDQMIDDCDKWMRECLIVAYNNITRGENQPLPEHTISQPELVADPELSEESITEYEDAVASKTPGPKNKSVYATPLKSPSKIPVSVKTPAAVTTATIRRTTRSSVRTRSVRSASATRGTATKQPAAVPPTTGRGQRSVSRLKQPQPGSATKPASASKPTLTDSAIKRKTEQDKQRALRIEQQIREKEEKAARQRQQNLETMVVEHKQKREEKERKVAMTREQLEKEANERRLRESAKKKEADRRRREIEETRKQMQKRADENAEAEKRAAEAAAAAARRMEEEEKAAQAKKDAEVRKKMQDRIQHTQQKHSTSMSLSTSLAHRMMANSFAAQNTNQVPMSAAPASHTSLISENGDSVMDIVNSVVPAAAGSGKGDPAATTDGPALAAVPNQTFNLNVTINGNATFSVPAAAKANDSMLPPPLPPPPPKLVSYDISDLNSDADSDDERNPRKAIPDWAKGQNFVDALTNQYSKVRKYRERDVIKTFRLCPTTVDLDDIFRGYNRTVIPKYDKRTSSAHWSSPPAKNLNLSESFWANASFSKSILETK